jgi:serine/threonine protein kinase
MSDKNTARLRDSDLPREGDLVDDRYRIKKIIGRGGMSCIVCAQQLAMQRDVAIKLLHPHVASEEATIVRFKREVHLAKSLAHPNIIQYYDYGTLPNGSMYLVMELLEGCDLHALIRREGNFGLHRAIEVTMQVLDGLTEAHAKSVIHRDLKPRNLFMLDLNRRGDFVKILDFGIAKSTRAEESELTKTGVVCGTPSYLAPELLITQHASPASDLYAVGLIFLEMLTGRRAFKADTMARTFFMQLRHPVPIPTRFRGTPLEQFLLYSLAKHPDDRFQSAQDMMDELDSLRMQMPDDIRLSPDDVDSLVDSAASKAPGMSALDNLGLEILRDPAWAITPTPMPFRAEEEDDIPTTLAELGSGDRMTVPSRAALSNSSGHHPTREYQSLADRPPGVEMTNPTHAALPSSFQARDANSSSNQQADQPNHLANSGFGGVPAEAPDGFGASAPAHFNRKVDIRTAEVAREPKSAGQGEESGSRARIFAAIGLAAALLIAIGLTLSADVWNTSASAETAGAISYDVPPANAPGAEAAEPDPAIAANSDADPDFAFVNKLDDPAPAAAKPTTAIVDEAAAENDSPNDSPNDPEPALEGESADESADETQRDRDVSDRESVGESARESAGRDEPENEEKRPKRRRRPRREPRPEPAATSVDEFMQNNTILGDDSGNELF